MKLPVKDADEFIKRFGSGLTKRGIYLRCKKTIDPGTRVLLNLQLADGSPLLRSPGKVEFVTTGVSGMGIRFEELPEEARKLIEEKLPDAKDEMPTPPEGAQRTHLELWAASELLGSNQGAPAPSRPPLKTGSVEGRSSGQGAEDSRPDLLALAQDVRRLKRSLRATWLTAAVLAIATFAAGRAMAPKPAAPPASPPVVITVEEPQDPDHAPAVEDELTPEERAQAEEIIASAEPPPVPPPEKKKPVVMKKKAPAKRTLVASNSARASDVSKSSNKPKIDLRAQEEAKQLSDALAAGRGSKCKAQFEAISEIVAKTRIAAHREAGIVLRARCFADTWRSEEAKNEFRRYLREFPKGKYAEEAKRVLAL